MREAVLIFQFSLWRGEFWEVGMEEYSIIVSPHLQSETVKKQVASVRTRSGSHLEMKTVEDGNKVCQGPEVIGFGIWSLTCTYKFRFTVRGKCCFGGHKRSKVHFAMGR